jgi:hypothetical protein
LEIRKKCAERREEEDGQFPVHAYLDLIDLKKIMEKHFALFDAAFREVGRTGGRKELEWLETLNKLRRFVGHPLKVFVTDYKFSDADLIFLRETDELVRKLRVSARVESA